MHLGLGHLRLPPDHFWMMTLQEFVAAVRPLLSAQSPRIERSVFDALIAAFPDQEDQNHG